MTDRKARLTKLSIEFSRDLYKDDVKRSLLPGKILLQGICCWPDNDSLRVTIVGWFLFWNLFVIESLHAIYAVLHLSDLGEAIEAAATVTTTMEGVVRVYAMLVKRDTINSMLVKVWKQFWSLKVLEPAKQKQLKRKAQMALVLTSSFLISAIISNSQISGGPYIRNRGMILKSAYPFDWQQYYLYEVLYAWQFFSDWYVLFVINAVDFFFIALVINCCVQYIILQDIFKYILTKESKRQRKVIFGERGETMTDKEMLLECLNQHTMLIRMCDELEEAFSISILIQFFVSTSAFCAGTILLKVDYSQFLKMLMYAAAHLSQLFYYCYAGHDLSYETGHLSDAIYHCNWHLTYDRDFRKALVLMIQRSQRIQCLTAAGITELNFASFLRIMRISFSFYTLLNNLLMKTVDK